LYLWHDFPYFPVKIKGSVKIKLFLSFDKPEAVYGFIASMKIFCSVFIGKSCHLLLAPIYVLNVIAIKATVFGDLADKKQCYLTVVIVMIII
jgi:hypothetical protein